MTSQAAVATVTPLTQPMRRIVVGSDFSEAATHALHVAIDLARMHDAEIVIVNAIDPMITTLDVPVQSLIDDVRAGLDEAAAMVSKAGVKVQTRQEFGKAWWVINETAMQTGADLVMVASHGHVAGHSRLAEGLARLLGSTADRVVRSCRKPVLVIPAGRECQPSSWSTAVVGVDFSQESAIAAAKMAQLLTGSERGAASSSSAAKPSLVLFHVVALIIDMGMSGASPGGEAIALTQPTVEHWEQAEVAAGKRLETWAAALRSERLNVECQTYRGFAPDGILATARSRKADLIAMGTHGLGAVNRMLLGSVAQRVLHHADCPVLTVRHPDHA